jgi:predicted NAD/FAD-binding protein
MNDLQHLPAEEYGPVLVTLNPPMEPACGTVAARFRYDHPVLNTEASGHLYTFVTAPMPFDHRPSYLKNK